MQYVHYLQRKYSLSSFNLLGHTAPAQAATLLLIGPFLDYWLTNRRVYTYNYNIVSVVSDLVAYELLIMHKILVIILMAYVICNYLDRFVDFNACFRIVRLSF